MFIFASNLIAMKKGKRRSFIFKNTRKKFFMSIRKLVAIMVIFVAIFSSCWEEKERKKEDKSPCDRWSLLHQYQWSGGNPPWVFEMIGECLENELYGSISRYAYKDGFCYLFEHKETSENYRYIFLNCEGEVVYEGTRNPIDAFPELNIKDEWPLMIYYPSWDSEQDVPSDEFLCYSINPFTLPRVKDMLYGCDYYPCIKKISICPYRDGVGFLLWNHLDGIGTSCDFLDCNGNLLCSVKKSGDWSFNPCTELIIEFENEKIILVTKSLSYPNH